MQLKKENSSNQGVKNQSEKGRVMKMENSKIFTSEMKPRWDEMDANGHINYMVYLSYYSEARLLALGQDVLMDLKEKNIGPFIYKVEVDYKKELRYPDTIRINTWISEIIGKTRSIIQQEIYSVRTNLLISTARFHAAFVDLNRRRPIPLPQVFFDHFF
ncbi:MAG: acyl-CoA thioesterase [Spirochaetia bacterium]|nr:acyl-CoA thioesterase [Spirochaetia bacterium]